MWETGRRPVSAKYMQVIMDYFKVSKAYLLGFTDDPKEELPQKENWIISLKQEEWDLSQIRYRYCHQTFSDFTYAPSM